MEKIIQMTRSKYWIIVCTIEENHNIESPIVEALMGSLEANKPKNGKHQHYH